MATLTNSVKEQVVDTIPKRVKELKFGIACVHSAISEKQMLTSNQLYSSHPETECR